MQLALLSIIVHNTFLILHYAYLYMYTIFKFVHFLRVGNFSICPAFLDQDLTSRFMT